MNKSCVLGKIALEEAIICESHYGCRSTIIASSSVPLEHDPAEGDSVLPSALLSDTSADVPAVVVAAVVYSCSR